MPYTRFKCPDGGEIDIDKCINEGCRLKGKINPVTGDLYVPCGRCLSAPTLRKISKQREWTGKPSTTQCLRGTRESYLILTHDYAIDPKSMMFALLGTQTHSNLESGISQDAGEVGEKRLDNGPSTGAFDFWSPDNGGTLVDYKTYSSYVVSRDLGLGSKKILIGHYKNGKPRYKTIITDGNAKLDFDLAVQMNDYRMKIQQVLNKPVSQMVCEMIIRDGNTYMANSRGIYSTAEMVPVGKISDRWMSIYMKKKSDDLISAMKNNRLPPPCKPRECWHGKKCEKWCHVNKYCDAYTGGNNG